MWCFFFNETATTEIYTSLFVCSVRCVYETEKRERERERERGREIERERERERER